MSTVCTDSSPPLPAGPLSENPDKAASRVLAALRDKSTSARQWAIKHGYPPRSVYAVIRDWAGRTDRHPHGGQARQIIRLLRQELGADLVPAPLTVRPRRRAAGTSKRASQ